MKTLIWLERYFERAILTGALFLIAGVLMAQVLMRYAFRSPFVWSEELARYVLVWAAMMGVSLAVREGRHISVDFLPTIMGPATTRFFATIAHLGVLVFCIVMVTASVPLIERLARIGQSSPTLGIPMWWVYASVPVGFGLAGLRTLQALYLQFTRPAAAAGKV